MALNLGAVAGRTAASRLLFSPGHLDPRPARGGRSAIHLRAGQASSSPEIWSPDAQPGSSSARPRPGPQMLQKSATGPAPTKRLPSPPIRTKIRNHWSADRVLILIAATIRGVRTTSSDCDLPMARRFQSCRDRCGRGNAQFSPDGRWIVYQSNSRDASRSGCSHSRCRAVSAAASGRSRTVAAVSRGGVATATSCSISRLTAASWPVPIKATAEARPSKPAARALCSAGRASSSRGRHRAAAIHGLEGWTTIPVRDRGRAAKQCAADDDPELGDGRPIAPGVRSCSLQVCSSR